MRKLIILILLISIALTSPAAAGEKLTLMLDWFPNVDHLPIYVAQEKGYFREAGIEVKILSPSDTSDALKLAVAGQVDLAVSYQPQTIIAAAGGAGCAGGGPSGRTSPDDPAVSKGKGLQDPF